MLGAINHPNTLYRFTLKDGSIVEARGDQEIVDYAVVGSVESGVETSPDIDVVHMHEKLERPEILVGSTYKVKTPLSGNDDPDGDFLASAQLCGKCYTRAVMFADGCMTCLSCGDSKCS